METTRTRPSWADKYLLYAAWTQEEFRNLLCGLPPNPLDDTPLPADMPVPTREEHTAAWLAQEQHRKDADRHIRDAVLAGDLTVLDLPDERLLAKIKADLAPEEWEALRRAVAHDRTCDQAYRVARDAAIRWAAPQRDLFPDFPFSADDIQRPIPPESLEPRERASLLTIIVALAEIAGVEKVNIAEPTKAAKIIETATSRFRKGLTQRTIEKHLKDANNEIGHR